MDEAARALERKITYQPLEIDYEALDATQRRLGGPGIRHESRERLCAALRALSRRRWRAVLLRLRTHFYEAVQLDPTEVSAQYHVLGRALWEEIAGALGRDSLTSTEVTRIGAFLASPGADVQNVQDRAGMIFSMFEEAAERGRFDVVREMANYIVESGHDPAAAMNLDYVGHGIIDAIDADAQGEGTT